MADIWDTVRVVRTSLVPSSGLRWMPGSQGPYVSPLPSYIVNTWPHLEALRPQCLLTTLVSTGLAGKVASDSRLQGSQL